MWCNKESVKNSAKCNVWSFSQSSLNDISLEYGEGGREGEKGRRKEGREIRKKLGERVAGRRKDGRRGGREGGRKNEGGKRGRRKKGDSVERK